MRVAFVLLAVIAIGIVNAATNTAPTTLSTETAMGLISSIDIALGGTNNKRFLRSDRELDDEAVEGDDEERVFLVKETPFYLKLINRLRGKKTFSVTSDQLAKLNKGYTRDIFTGWVQRGHSIETFQNTFKKLVKSKMITKERYDDFVVWYRDVKKSIPNV